MRRVKIFSGTSHPSLTSSICERLGTSPSKCELTKFSNGETSVSIGTSIREQDVFIVQSGSKRINDSLMELLIMISACKGGSSRSITAVIPYFPYSRQSKKKSHRGAITARMLANLLSVAGVDHVITVDLHAPPMQGFFGKPVDNLRAEPIIARWIRLNVRKWHEAVVVSKNPGGSKRVTSLADTLKLSFGIITTDRRRSPHRGSIILDPSTIFGQIGEGDTTYEDTQSHEIVDEPEYIQQEDTRANGEHSHPHSRTSPALRASYNGLPSGSAQPSPVYRNTQAYPGSPLQQTMRAESETPPTSRTRPRRRNVPVSIKDNDFEDPGEEYTDERAREVITGRLIQGHIVDDDFPSPMLSTMSGSVTNLASIGPSQFEDRDPMTASFMSTASSVQPEHAISGTYDGADLSDEEEERLKDPEVEHTVTLVGDVNEKTVFIIDDIMDRSESWIAAAETVVKRGGATEVYCIATHALFDRTSFEELDSCDCIDHIVVCNTFPINSEELPHSDKLVILDLAGMLAEAIRRNHFGESITQLYQHYQD